MKNLLLLLTIFFIGPCIPSAVLSQHQAGKDCIHCHKQFSVGGTVYSSYDRTGVKKGASATLVDSTGAVISLPLTDNSGRLYANSIPDGRYLVKLGNIRSRSWHLLPEQRSCNTCHTAGGNPSARRTKTFPQYHTEIPSNNSCLSCHYFPASMNIDMLKTPGQLNGEAGALNVLQSFAILEGQEYSFNPSEFDGVPTVRPDIFAPGFYSLFDVILKIANKHGIDVTYHWDDSCQTHFIDTFNGKAADYWYHFQYDVGRTNTNELKYRRQIRWDELLYQPGSSVKLVTGENLPELKQQFRQEIERERSFGHLVTTVNISINPSGYNGNPPGSGRVTVARTFNDVPVTSHGIREKGRDSLYISPFQPGVVTAMDVLYSLVDSGKMTLIERTYFTRLAQKVMQSYRVRAMGFPDVGMAHASGSQGFVYTTGNGDNNRLINQADQKQHVHADIHVIHAPDFARWRWIELGNPYYERDEPTRIEEVLADYNARDKGFRLQLPYPNPATGKVRIPYNIFEAGNYTIDIYSTNGKLVEKIFAGRRENIGVQSLEWNSIPATPGTYYIRMTDGRSLDVQRVEVVR